jgi:hypothetical protein
MEDGNILGFIIPGLMLLCIIYVVIKYHIKKMRWKPRRYKLSTVRNKNWSNLKFSCQRSSVDFKKHDIYIKNIKNIYLKNKDVYVNTLLKKRKEIWYANIKKMTFDSPSHHYIKNLESVGWFKQIEEMADEVVLGYVKEIYKDVFNIEENSFNLTLIKTEFEEEFMNKVLDSKCLGIMKEDSIFYTRDKTGLVRQLFIKLLWCIELESKIHKKLRIYNINIKSQISDDHEEEEYFKGIIYIRDSNISLQDNVQISNIKWNILPVGLKQSADRVAIPYEFKDEEREKIQVFANKNNAPDILKIAQPRFIYSIIQESKFNMNKYSLFFSANTSTSFIAVHDFWFPNNDPEHTQGVSPESSDSYFVVDPWTIFQDDYSLNYWTLKLNPTITRVFRLIKYLDNLEG